MTAAVSMNATSSQTQGSSPAGAAFSVAEIDASARVPLFVLFVSAAFWLVASSVLGLLASLKFHSPGFLADCEILTYGRVHAAANIAFLYGFAVQAGFGVALWVIARTGLARVAHPWLVAIGGKFWNLGVLLGVLGILGGDGTGFENLEMPHYAGWLMFIGQVGIGLHTLFTLHRRTEKNLQPAQWFLLASTFWFTWIFSTARLLLVWWPVRGLAQASIAWWFGANLTTVWLGLAGVGALFYFVPRLMNKPLHSRGLALFTFWTLILFGSWSGIPPSAPLPAWMPVLSAIAAVLTIIPALAVVVNVSGTVKGCAQTENPPPGKFFAFAVMAVLFSSAMRAAAAVPQVSQVLDFTWFKVAQSQLNNYGFFALTMFGAIYDIVPQVTGIEWPKPGFVRLHCWLAQFGIMLIVIPLAIAGVLQGMKLSGAPVVFTDVTKATLIWLRISTTGEIFILVGHLLLAVNLIGLSARYYRTHFLPAYAAATAELKPAEVKP